MSIKVVNAIYGNWMKINFGSVSNGVTLAVEMMRRILDEEYK